MLIGYRGPHDPHQHHGNNGRDHSHEYLQPNFQSLYKTPELQQRQIDGALLMQDRSQASAVVSILKDNVERRVLSVSALNQPNEYEVTYTVGFSVTAGDKELLPPQEISTTRSYSFDARLLLAKGHEADILRGAMAQGR